MNREHNIPILDSIAAFFLKLHRPGAWFYDAVPGGLCDNIYRWGLETPYRKKNQVEIDQS
jgi:hypothetical protein